MDLNKVLLLVQAGVLFYCGVFAQNDLDVIRYSQTGIGGDARFTAMGGSFGALGANLSCLHYNPAGMAVYRNGEIGISGSLRFATVNARHYDNPTTDYAANFQLPNMGLVAAWEETSPFAGKKNLHPVEWSRRHAIGISISKLAGFNYNTSIEANVKNSSIVNDFVNAANGKNIAQLNPFYEGLAWNAWLINQDSGTVNYWGMVDPYTTVKQTRTIQTSGHLSEISLAYAYAYNNKLYLGASLGIPRVKYTYNSKHSETDAKDSIPWFGNMSYTEYLQSSGTGINLKVGVLYRFNSWIRGGLSIHTRSIIALNDNYSNGISASYDNDNNTPLEIRNHTFNYDTSGYFRYTVLTPMRAAGSLALIANKRLAFNIDGEYINYAGGNLRSSPMVFGEVNNEIRKKYNYTFNLRTGMELNLNPIMLRAGYALYGSPFGNVWNGNFVRHTYCAGIGLRRNENMYIDFAVAVTQYSEDFYLYSPTLVNVSKLNYGNTVAMVSVGKKF